MFIFSAESDKFLALGESMFLYSAILWACVMPIIFNFFVIPKIEKRLGKKLTFPFQLYNFYPFSKCIAKHIEVTVYICIKLLGIKKEPNSNLALSKMNNVEYDIKTASKLEIIMSIIDVIILTTFFVGLGISISKFNDAQIAAQEYFSQKNSSALPSIPVSQKQQDSVNANNLTSAPPPLEQYGIQLLERDTTNRYDKANFFL